MYFGIGQAQIVSIATETRVTLPSHLGKMRARLSALAILALSAATLTSARADPPPLGQAVNFPEPMVVCKTHRELKELVEALRISVEAYDAKLKQLGVDRSECDINTISDVFVVEFPRSRSGRFQPRSKARLDCPLHQRSEGRVGTLRRGDRVECGGGYSNSNLRYSPPRSMGAHVMLVATQSPRAVKPTSRWQWIDGYGEDLWRPPKTKSLASSKTLTPPQSRFVRGLRFDVGSV